MIKVIPLLLVPSVFLIIFLNVKNLTSQIGTNFSNNLNDRDVVQQEYTLEDDVKKIDKSSEDFDRKSEIQESENKKPLEKKILEKTDKQDNKRKDNLKDQIVLDDIKRNLKSKELEKKVETKGSAKKKKENIKKLIKIQFGAFSKLKNAEEQKESISNVISRKFPEFRERVKISNENKLHKILYELKSIKKAESICKFSKSNKISCIIIKK
jgi:hypothetical protein